MATPYIIPQQAADDLNAILRIEDKYARQEAIDRWLNPEDITRSDAKFKTASGKPMRIPVKVRDQRTGGWRTEQYLIPPAGRRLPRPVVLRFLQTYGELGRYRGKHRPTGLTQYDLLNTPAETLGRMKLLYPNLEEEIRAVSDDYLIHVPDQGFDDALSEIVANQELSDSTEIEL